jgi:D-alanine-D-alanine ligase
VKVVLLMGGNSAEREISLRTGHGIAQSLRSLGHEVTAIDAADGRLIGPGEQAAARLEGPHRTDLPEVSVRAVSDARSLADAEVVFIALHGGAGENGTIQALLELSGRPYTGSGVMASAVAMNKAMSKRVFEREGIPTPRWQLVHADRLEPVDATALGGYPLIVKPNEQGSSVALTVVTDPNDLPAALDLSFEYGREALIEEFIPGRELTVAVLGDEPLPIVEIRPRSGHYDYESKYTSGASEYFCPADLPEPLARHIRELGVRAALALDCEGVSRTDFRLSPDEVPYCLEVNTIPGMTPLSLVPMAAKAHGLSYDQLVARMLELAQDAWRRRHAPAPPRRTGQRAAS